MEKNSVHVSLRLTVSLKEEELRSCQSQTHFQPHARRTPPLSDSLSASWKKNSAPVSLRLTVSLMEEELHPSQPLTHCQPHGRRTPPQSASDSLSASWNSAPVYVQISHGEKLNEVLTDLRLALASHKLLGLLVVLICNLPIETGLI